MHLLPDGQVCYKLDVNELKESGLFKQGPEGGITFLMDYNEERNFGKPKETRIYKPNYNRLINKEDENDDIEKHAKIYIELLEPFAAFFPGIYSLDSVKQITGTKEFYAFAAEQNMCQNQGTVEECNAKKLLEEVVQKCECIPFEMMILAKQYQVKLLFLTQPNLI